MPLAVDPLGRIFDQETGRIIAAATTPEDAAFLAGAVELLSQVSVETSGHDHFDPYGTHGNGCDACIRQRAFYERIRAHLKR